jgi:hypothetical protein
VPIVRQYIRRGSDLMTDEARYYTQLGKEFASHGAVHHCEKEYVRYESTKTITTNTVEGYYIIFKRGMKGVYQHRAEKHLHSYLAEFDFRYNTRVALGYCDAARAERAMKGIVGKRLMYRRPRRAEIN